MNCIAIDDEPLALNIIKDFAGKLDFLNLQATFTNAIDAIIEIEKGGIDLIFLDIQMPHITGLEFIKSLEKPPMIIFTTAYSEHAHEAFDLNAVDYLVKPIPFERFIKAVNKAKKQLQNNQEKTQKHLKDEFFMVNAEYATLKIFYKNILYIEGLKDYVKIFLPGQMILTKTTMKKIEERLPSEWFIRVHKSFIINMNHIERIENHRILINKERIPVSATYKDVFFKLIDQFKL